MSKISLKPVLVLAVLLLAALPAAAEEMTLDQVVAKNMEARGGEDAWEAIKSVKIVGQMAMGQGIEAPFTIYFKRPDKMRLEFQFQGMTAVQAYDGSEGWQVMPMMGSTEPAAMSEDELKRVRNQADFEGPLFNWAEKGHEVELIGKEEVEGTEAYKLKIKTAEGDESFTFLDADHFLEFRQESSMTTPTGQELQTEVTFGDYKEVGDIVMYHSVEMKPVGAPAGQVITFSSVEVNTGDVDDAMFTKPAAEKAEAPSGR
ncbi:MAG: hypothetical protein AAGN66_14460 [Acidobacteriota bacterium]